VRFAENQLEPTSDRSTDVIVQPVRRLVLSCALLAATTHVAGAQEVIWSRTLEANANLLFGAAAGRVGALIAEANRADSALDLRAELRFSYADAPDGDGNVSVTARSSRLTLGIDHRPFGQFSPFAFGTAESSLQQRIDSRYALGGGAKLLLVPPGDNEASISLALLWEQTRARDPEPDVDPTTALARWSLRFRANRRLTSNVTMSHQTLWQPATSDLGLYTTETSTGLSVALNSSLSLTVTLRDKYDSEAIIRGADSNHDGQLLFGVRAKF
jgi:hypothetical protein